MNYHDIPDPDQTTEGRSKINAESSPLSPAKQAKKYRPKGADLEPPVSTIARFAGRLIDRLTGKAYSADEIAANSANVVAALAAGSPAAVTALSIITVTAATTINLTSADSGKIYYCTASSPVTINMPDDDPGGPFSVAFIRGDAAVTFAPNGHDILSYNGLLSIAGQHAWASLIRVDEHQYNLSGTLA